MSVYHTYGTADLCTYMQMKHIGLTVNGIKYVHDGKDGSHFISEEEFKKRNNKSKVDSDIEQLKNKYKNINKKNKKRWNNNQQQATK